MVVKKNKRQQAYRRGRIGELVAGLWLRLHGYRVLARRWSCAAGEIDLVVRKRDVVAFVEVKTRAEMAQAADALTQRQWQRIARASRIFLARYRLQNCSWRYDCVLLAPYHYPKHIIGAWEG